jgi:hypothetical protein
MWIGTAVRASPGALLRFHLLATNVQIVFVLPCRQGNADRLSKALRHRNRTLTASANKRTSDVGSSPHGMARAIAISKSNLQQKSVFEWSDY